MSGFLDMPGVSDAGGTDIGDGIPYSLMLDSGLSQYLTYTPAAGATTSRKKNEFHIKFKRGKNGTRQTLLQSGSASNDTGNLGYYIGTDDKLHVEGGSTSFRVSSKVFRAFDGYYFLTFSLDTSQATAVDRLKISDETTGLITAWDTNNPITLNSDMAWFQNVAHYIGNDANAAGRYFDGYVSQVYLVEDQNYGESGYTRISADTLQRVNKTFAGSFGTRGSKLEFANPSALGTDTSGNGNNWTTNGGITSANQYTDTPNSLTTGNSCVINPLSKTAGTLVISKGNTKLGDGSALSRANSTLQVSSGKYYFESEFTTAGANSTVGFGQGDITNQYPGQDALSFVQDLTAANKMTGAVTTSYGTALTTGNVFRGAIDLDNLKVFFGAASWFNSSDPAAGTNPAFTIPAGAYEVIARPYTTGAVLTFNFGQRPFTYPIPTGFKALCTANLPTPAIPDPTKHIYVATVAKSGNTDFTLPWSATDYDTRFKIKIRNTTGSHAWIDGLRGYDKVLFSDTTAAEITNANYITVSGTTITLGSALPDGSYVIEAMKAGLVSARQTNTNGTITSTVSANQLAGFSIVMFSGILANATVGHGLLKPVEMFSVKRQLGIGGWFVYNRYLTSADNFLYLNLTDVQGTQPTLWNSTHPTSSVLSVGSSFGPVVWVAYCHHSVEGYSKFGKFVTNGSADGVFTNCGFKPISITYKDIDNAGAWLVGDTVRSQYNPMIWEYQQNSAGGEYSTVAAGAGERWDSVSTGMKHRTANGGVTTVIYSAYGYPTKFATGR